jgi:hypothetical protein
MGMFDQMKMAQQMMKNMSPGEIKEMMQQAKESQNMLNDQISKVVEAEIEKRGLIGRDEVQRMIDASK